MRLSVLLATRNRPALLQRSISCLLEQRRPPDELVVIDQSDDDASEIVVAHAPRPAMTAVRYQRIARTGKTAALNLALGLSSGDLLALTDDDVLVDPSWLETLERLAADHPAIAAFCGRVLPEPGTRPEDYLNLVLEAEPRVIDDRVDPVMPSVCGANLAVRRDAFIAVGMYNPHFGPGGIFRSNDDGELAYRLTRGRFRVRYSPELLVVHTGWRGAADNQSLTFDYAYSLGAFAGYYLRRRDWLPSRYLAKTWAYKALCLARGLVRRDAKQTADAWLHLRAILKGFGHGLTTGPGHAPRALAEGLGSTPNRPQSTT